MSEFHARSEFDSPAEDLYAWHARPAALLRLIPLWQRVEIVERDGTIRDGDRLLLRLRAGPLSTTWEARHRGHIEGRRFIDELARGPMRRWIHTHAFEPLGAARSRLHDFIAYEPPGGSLGRLALHGFVRAELERLFTWRHMRTGLDVRRHRAAAVAASQARPTGAPPTMRVLIGGASGLIGSALTYYLESGGHQVYRLVRVAGRARAPVSSGPREIPWDPQRGALPRPALEGFDAVIHLGGANIAGGRWTAARKRLIERSRVQSTELLSRALAELAHPPRVFVCASAIGYYGDRGDELLDERSPPGDGFLPRTCMLWEQAARPAIDAGIRTVTLRLGVVLAARGGALGQMLPPFRLGMGAVLGDGRQPMSWIALEDLLGMIEFILAHERVAGAVNATAPHPVSNAEFTHTLAQILRRPAFLRAPAGLVRAGLGEMSAMLLGGARVLPIALARAGFPFAFPRLEEALRWELGRFRAPIGQTISVAHI